MPDELEQRLTHYGYLEIQAHYALKDKNNPIHTVINKHILKQYILEQGADNE